jgi:hypothetical protein
MARRRKKHRLGQSQTIMMLVESDSGLAREKAAIETSLVQTMCRGISVKAAAPHAFSGLANRAARKIQASPDQERAAVVSMTRDFIQNVDNCRRSPFCELSTEAEALLTSKTCRVK